MLNPSWCRQGPRFWCLAFLFGFAGAAGAQVVSLDGTSWRLACDSANKGLEQRWFVAPRPEAKPARVPWIIQDTFPGYHGIAWFWRGFEAPANPHPGGRTLLRFWAVDYKADVWLNGIKVGSHEGGESPFTLDITGAVKPGADNLLALRVINPIHTPIDGIVLNETPHRNKALPYSAGSTWNQGGIMDSVELILSPAVRITDLFVRPDWKSGSVRGEVTVFNAAENAVSARIECGVAPASSGETLEFQARDREFPPGESRVEVQFAIRNPRPWDLNNPFLYRFTARVSSQAPVSRDEFSVRFGFRDFRFERGWFRLNGRRFYLRSSHTGNCVPIGLELPHDPDLLRRDLINAKMARFNCVRFIAGVPKRYQLDLCDEIGLLVYEESYAGWCLADSPAMKQRFNESVLGMIRRDRNHPSVVIWGLLNETPDSPVFRHAVSLLPDVRALDDSRMVMLNSGRWDAPGGGLTGLEVWQAPDRTEPCVTRNPTPHPITGLGITWRPGQLAFHPGQHGEFASVRWTSSADGAVELDASFESIAERATTDVHLLHNGRPLFMGFINVRGGGPRTNYAAVLNVKSGDTIDCAVGFGNGSYGADTTALAVRVKAADGKTFDAAADFSAKRNPNGPWACGLIPPGSAPDSRRFAPFTRGLIHESVGSLSNPGSTVWEDVLNDTHPYQRVPHTASIIQFLRTTGNTSLPLFLSEYGIGSAVDLIRAARHYEQLGAEHAMDAQFYRAQLDRFQEDWKRWRLQEAFARPEDFFAESNARMAGQRLLGLNAIRSNPNVVAHSITGTVDQGMTGEGCWTTFRELKPGTTDALFDGWAPLRWCLFVESPNVYRGDSVRVEVVLANEDVLPPGAYPARLQMVGPRIAPVWEQAVTVRIPSPSQGDRKDPPMVVPVFAGEVRINAPEGKFRLLANLEKGGAALGGETEFYVHDQAAMPPVDAEVLLWGTDDALLRWLSGHGIRARSFAGQFENRRQVILSAAEPPAPGGRTAFRELAAQIARGSTVIFLSPGVFAAEKQPTAWVPLAQKGRIEALPAWLYHKEDWCKPHSFFEGLPSGGLMDYTFYREIIPDHAWTGLNASAEAVAGGINAALAYSSGLTLSVHRLGDGWFVLNTLRIRENLGSHPAAERLLRNMLRLAGRDANKAASDLPANFGGLLQEMGYE